MEAADAPTTLDAGLVLGRYRLGERLGTGGFGTVYAGFDERLQREVAVKVISADPSVPGRAAREALAAARLDHPGIVAVYDAGEEPARDGGEGALRYLISELVRGRTLAQLEADEALSDRDVLRVGLALADALAHAHERGVVHRDVKPQNVMVPDRPESGRGVAKLTDFGVAHLLDDDALTRTGDVVGTLAYMAPEQAEGRRVDERTDLYALALVLYEALAGRNPVRGAGPAATARKVGTAIPPLGRARRDLPAGLCAAIDRCVRPRPAERGTVDDLSDALVDALESVADEGGAVARHPLEGPVRVPAPPPGIRRVAAGLAAGGLLAAGASAAGTAPELPPPVAGAVAALAVALLPRFGWIAAAAALAAALAGPAPGAALVVVAAALPVPILTGGRAGLGWSLPAAAPLLGAFGLAGAFPALAGRARAPAARAALAVLGAWWLALAEPLAGRPLLLGAGTRPGPGWEDGAARAADAVLWPAVTSGTLLIGVLWGLGAAVLPVLVRGRHGWADLAVAGLWATGLALATEAVAGWLGGPEPVGLVPSALVGVALAVAGARVGPARRGHTWSVHEEGSTGGRRGQGP